MPTDPHPRRADVWLGAVSCAALVLGAYAALRPPAAAPDPAAAELAQLRQELAELRHSLAVTRNQMSAPGSSGAIAEIEQRLARVETTARATSRPVAAAPTSGADDSAGSSETQMPDGSPRYVDLKPTSSAVTVKQLESGAIVATSRDPALAGQSMAVKARTADGREEDVTITLPPAG